MNSKWLELSHKYSFAVLIQHIRTLQPMVGDFTSVQTTVFRREMPTDRTPACESIITFYIEKGKFIFY